MNVITLQRARPVVVWVSLAATLIGLAMVAVFSAADDPSEENIGYGFALLGTGGCLVALLVSFMGRFGGEAVQGAATAIALPFLFPGLMSLSIVVLGIAEELLELGVVMKPTLLRR